MTAQPKPPRRHRGITERKYIYSKADVERMIAEAIEKFGTNEARNPLGYIGGMAGQRRMFAFAEHKQPFYKGKFRKLGFTE